MTRSECARAQARPSVVLLLLVVLASAGPRGAAHAATTDDGAPAPLFLIGDDRVPEASGIALSRRHRLLWIHNDAGNTPEIFGLRPTGATQVRVGVEGAAAEDWEDIAVATVGGRDWIYLDDVGDAYQVRKAEGLTFRRRFEIVRFPEPEVIPPDGDVRVTAEVFPVEFEDAEGVNVESMAVRESGAILLVEKIEPGSGRRAARVWRIERPVRDRLNVPVEVARIPVVGVASADLSLDGTAMVVRDARSAMVYDLRRGLEETFAAPVRRVVLPEQDQGEGVAFTLDDRGLVVSGEGRAAAVWFVPLTPGAEPIFGPRVVAPAGDTPERGRETRTVATAGNRVISLPRSVPVLVGGLALVGFALRSWRRSRRGGG